MMPEIYSLLSEEVPYTFPQHKAIESQTGCVGRMEAEPDAEQDAFTCTWTDVLSNLHTLTFQAEFQKTMQSLKLDPLFSGMLQSPQGLSAFCRSNPQFSLPDGSGYGVRIDSAHYAFLVRTVSLGGPLGFTLSAYRKDWLDQHLENARDGIRFLDSAYRELFRIPDGGQILIQSPNGQTRVEPCRYIDAYHIQAGRQIYHICEFADRTEKSGLTVRPVPISSYLKPGKENRHAGIDR